MTNIAKYIGLLLIILIVPFYSSASCTSLGKEVPGYVYFGKVVVQRNISVGSVIATSNTGAYNNGQALVSCTETWYFNINLVKWLTLSNLERNIYDTNIPGVGIRLSLLFNGIPYPFPYSSELVPNRPMYIPDIKAELIKTGAIISGKLDTGILVKGRILDTNGESIFNVTLNGNNTISSVGCDVMVPNIGVQLGKHRIQEFDQKSVTEWTDFDISLDCDKNTPISITINATPDISSSTPDIIKLDNDEGSASGIGIQLFMQDVNGLSQQVKLNKSQAYGSAFNNGINVIKFQARYYKIVPQVNPGIANATVTFTMTYD